MLAALIAAGAGELGSMAAAAELATAATTAAELGTAAAGAAELGTVAAAAAPEIIGAAAAPIAETVAAPVVEGVTSALPVDQVGAMAEKGIEQGIQGGANPVFTQAGPAPTNIPQGIDQGLNVQSSIDPAITNNMPNGGFDAYGQFTQAPGPIDPATANQAAAPKPYINGPPSGGIGNPVDINQGLLRGVDYEAIPGVDVPHAGAVGEKTGLQKGFESAMKFTKDNPLATSLGIQAVGKLMDSGGGGGGPQKKTATRKDMGRYNANDPSTIQYNPIYQSTPYAEGGIAYAVGGPVEQMSAQNAIGANTGYPMANLQTPMYTNPQISRPTASNVIAPSADTGVDTYTGEMKFAKGGTTKSEPNYSEMMGIRSAEQQKADEDYLQAYAKREMAGSINHDSDIETAKQDPLHASLTKLKKIGKRVGIKPVDLPKSGVTDSNVFHAAIGGTVPSMNAPAPNPDRQYYNPNNSALRAEQAQNAAMPDMGIFGFLSQMFGGIGPYGLAPNGAKAGPNLGAGMDPNKKQIHYTGMAQGGITHGLGGYSDGGRLLKGPGDGVSDSIPATIGNRQPARLADGEFVVPARIVSELGNGSTEAGARKLYEMMERVQADRKKSIGKGKVAVNSKAAKHLPK